MAVPVEMKPRCTGVSVDQALKVRTVKQKPTTVPLPRVATAPPVVASTAITSASVCVDTQAVIATTTSMSVPRLPALTVPPVTTRSMDFAAPASQVRPERSAKPTSTTVIPVHARTVVRVLTGSMGSAASVSRALWGRAAKATRTNAFRIRVLDTELWPVSSWSMVSGVFVKMVGVVTSVQPGSWDVPRIRASTVVDALTHPTSPVVSVLR